MELSPSPDGIHVVLVEEDGTVHIACLCLGALEAWRHGDDSTDIELTKVENL